MPNGRGSLWLAACAGLVAGCAQPASGADVGDDASDEPGISLFATKDGVHTGIQLADGVLEGVALGETRAFHAIPYAKPPLGELRFAPPAPPEPWRGVRDATKPGPECPQTSYPPYGSTDPMSEDCLTLDVYAPLVLPKKPVPVMVYMHGGGFAFGWSNEQDGTSLSAAGPVVVVTINYRLGALGLFTHPLLNLLPNNALRDQQQALRWVRHNIASFGGDPDNVTLMGESTGSRSTCFQIVLPGSQGLAQRFIMQSDDCARAQPAAAKSDNDALGRMLGEELCGTQQGDALLECLRGLNAFELINWNANEDDAGFAGWDVCVDGPGGVLPKSAAELFASGEYTDAPVMLGSTKREYLQIIWNGLDTADPMNAIAFERFLVDGYGQPTAMLLGAEYHADGDTEVEEQYVRMQTDIMVRCPTRALARTLSDHGNRVFLYSFEQGDAIHGDDMPFVFGADNLPTFREDASALDLHHDMQGYWTRFARTGDPNGAGTAEWPQFTRDGDRHMVLAAPPMAGRGLAKSGCDLLDDLIAQGIQLL